MNEYHLLDILAQRQGCFISDLRLNPILRRAAFYDLCSLWGGLCPLKEWEEAVHYLTGSGMEFESIDDIKRFLLEEVCNGCSDL